MFLRSWRSHALLATAMVVSLGCASAFQAPAVMSLRNVAPSTSSKPAMGISLRGVAAHGRKVIMMGAMLESGEMALTDEECERLNLPPNTVVPADSVDRFKKMLQDAEDEAVRKLARQIGTAPEKEPYPGYFKDIERLNLQNAKKATSSDNPASLYGPDGKPYAPWMVGKVSETYKKRESKAMTTDEKKFSFASRGQELSGVGLSASLLGDEVRLTWTVEGEKNSRGYIVTKRPGGTEDGSFTVVADYQTPGAMLESGRINGQYSYVDGTVKPGVWVYRVQEEDLDGTKTTLSQTIIDVPSNADKIKTLIAAGVLGSVLTALTVASVVLDPQNGIGGK